MTMEDRGSAIRVERLTAIPVGAKGYVKVETNMGVVGWGEINNVETKVACALAESLGSLIIGENPTRIEFHWQRLFRAHRNLRGGGLMMHVIAAIDMALWDLAGKLYQVPVYRLLGGPCRDKVWMYPSPKAIKVSPGGARYHAGTPAEVAELVQRVADARSKVGPDGAVMFDAHSMLPLPLVKQFSGYLKPDDLLFLEEAWVPGNIEAMHKLRAAVPVPLNWGARPHHLGGARDFGGPSRRYPTARLRPRRRHQPDAEGRRFVRGASRADCPALHHVVFGLDSELTRGGIGGVFPHPRGVRAPVAGRRSAQDVDFGRGGLCVAARGAGVGSGDRRGTGDCRGAGARTAV